MHRRGFLFSLLLGTSMLAAPRASLAADQPNRPPNIVIILIDDLGWKDLGCMGSTFYETPNIDRLARQGMIFTNAYANAPNCAPSRACLLTGQYTPRHGIYTVNSSERGPKRLRKLIPTPNTKTLKAGAVTIAEELHSAGYATAAMGKWHLGKGSETGPQGQGFDVNIAGNHAGHPASYFSPYRNPDIADGPPGEYLTDRLTDEAVKFIGDNSERPFFLYLSHYAVHSPLRAKPALTEKYRQKQPGGGHAKPVYAAMIESVDQGVGRIVTTLDKLALADNTVVVFFSDNGGWAGATSMTPLRGCKGMLYEGGIRVPLIVRWPGKVVPETVCDTPVIGTDLFPTILGMVGIAPTADGRLDGESMMPLLTQAGGLKRDTLFWHFPAYLQAGAGVEGTWRTTPAGAIRRGDWKLIEFFEDDRLELYNLTADIGEATNLAETQPEKAAELHSALRAWREAVNAPVPTTANPEYDPEADR